MTGRFIYSPRAERQLNEINDWITRSASADVANRFLTAVRAHIESLSTFPMAGRARGDIRAGLRTATFKKRMVVAYLVDEDSDGRVITVLGVFHGGQDWMRALSADDEPAP
jgi:toxin ParE1/3/4